MTPVERLLRDLVALLEEMPLPYALMGGIAVRAHGLPRPTYDVDVTVSVTRDRLPELFSRIEEIGYDIGDQYRGGWLDTVANMPLFKASTSAEGRTVVADIFVAENEFQIVVIERRVRAEIEGLSAWFVTPEDLIILKIVADRYRDRIDVADVLTMNPSIDHIYIEGWAERLDVMEVWRKALEEFQQ